MAAYGLEKARAKREKAKTEKRKQAKREKREYNRQDLSWQHEQCQKAFNRLRVIQEKLWFYRRGQRPQCISCERENMDWCAGHFKSRGAQSNLRYDPKNVFLQCNRHCNQALSANISGTKTTRGYLQGLVDRFGDEEAQQIIDHCETNTAPYKWDWQELEQWRKEWRAEIRELEKELSLYE
jgi:hypothetical protein